MKVSWFHWVWRWSCWNFTLMLWLQCEVLNPTSCCAIRTGRSNASYRANTWKVLTSSNYHILLDFWSWFNISVSNSRSRWIETELLRFVCRNIFKAWVPVFFFPGKDQMELIQENGAKLYDLLSPFMVFRTTSTTMAGIRQIGVMTRAKMMLGGGSLSVSVGHSWKKLEWISTNMFSTSLLGHGSSRHSAMSSEHTVNLL